MSAPGRHPVWTAAGVVTLLMAVVAGVYLSWPPRAPAQLLMTQPVSTATVQRTDVASRRLVSGTLGYAGSFAVVDQESGIATWLPSPGTVVARNRPLFRVDGRSVILFYGATPAWRTFELGMAPGPDIKELQANLAELGYDSGHRMTSDDRFTWATVTAIRRWQIAHSFAPNGTIPFGQVVFLPRALRVAQAMMLVGQPMGTGQVVLEGASTAQSVSVALPVDQGGVRIGDRVSVSMPGGTVVPGRVVAVGRVATVSASAAAGNGTGAATIAVSIALEGRAAPGLDQAPVQVTITQLEHRGVLAVPVTALMARSGGGYAIQLATGLQQVIAVSLGLFDDSTGLVEVSGSGLSAGQQVEVAAG